SIECDLLNKDYTGHDAPDCLKLLRQEMERDGCLVLCAGARVDAYVSNMSRDMGLGTVYYILRMGQMFSKDETVKIFDPASPEIVGTIEQQDQYFARWRESLK